jgi:hypothetical protein
MPPSNADRGPAPLASRLLAGVILALMAVATAYAAWIAAVNWQRIGV